MTRYDEERLGELLAALRPAPEGWVAAAKALPAARRAIATLESELRSGADLETQLRAAGFEPDAALLDAVRRQLAAGSL
jgi:hypothetical protein